MRAATLMGLCLFVLSCGPKLPGNSDAGDEAGQDESGSGTTGGGNDSATTTGETTPGETTPGETTPGETSPGETAPGGTDPGETGPGETTTTGEETGGVTTGADPSFPDPTGPRPDPVVWPPEVVMAVLSLSLQEGELPAFAELDPFMQGDGECPLPSCDANTAPILGEPVFFVNGVWTETLDVHVGDRVGVVLSYTDDECNLHCGSVTAGAHGPFESLDSLGSLFGLACASGPGLGLDFTVIEGPGLHDWFIKLSDDCGSTTAAKGNFEVAP